MSIFAQLKEKVTAYIDVNIRLLKINFIERTSSLFSYLIFVFICLFISFGILLFLGFVLSEAFIDAGLSRVISYLLTLGVYCLLLFVLVALRRNVTSFFTNVFIRVLTEADSKKKKEIDEE